MIQKVTTAQHRASFLAAANAHIATRAQLSARLTLFADLPGSGWQFYTSADATPLAIALRGASATVVGACDPEELGSFLAFLGIDCVTMRRDTPPQGYAYKQTLTAYTLSAGQQLPLPPFAGAMAGQEAAMQLDTEPSIGAMLPLLWGEDDGSNTELRDQYYADQCTARNAGVASFWLLRHQGVPIFTLAASAVMGQDVYLSAGETVEAYRGQGVGGHYIAKVANEYAATGYDVCFVCEAVRCRFYQRLGFQTAGELHQFTPCSQDAAERKKIAEP